MMAHRGPPGAGVRSGLAVLPLGTGCDFARTFAWCADFRVYRQPWVWVFGVLGFGLETLRPAGCQKA
jgi:hypothetical protein